MFDDFTAAELGSLHLYYHFVEEKKIWVFLRREAKIRQVILF